jgi:hypothetical protein
MKNNIKLTTEEIREEIYTDLIQEYDHLSRELIMIMVEREIKNLTKTINKNYETNRNE